MTFSQKALQYVKSGSRVLDLGAGDGWFAKECVQRQAPVTAVDQHQPKDLNPDIDWQVIKVQDFIDRLVPSVMYDVIYSRNLIQFLDSAWVEEKLFPTMLQHIQPSGIIAIQTFYRDPEPPFESNLQSLYTTQDIKQMLPGLNILQEGQLSDTSPDRRGIQRTFFVTNVIAQQIAT